MHHLEIEEQERREAAIKRRTNEIRAQRADDAIAKLRRRTPVVGPAVGEAAVDWSVAPYWARYWAMDSIGRADWHERAPIQYGGNWESAGAISPAPTFGGADVDWEDSLVERPAAIKDRFTTDDTVNHPSHYTQGGIECIEVLEQLAADGHDFRILNAMKYLWRYRHKGGDESLRKARWYIERVLGES